jgi:hypothetical protein
VSCAQLASTTGAVIPAGTSSGRSGPSTVPGATLR